MNWFWLIGIGLFAVAAGGLFLAFRNPQFVAGLTAVAVKAAWGQIKPVILKRMPPDDEAEWRKLQNRGASQKEINEWQKMRKRRKLQK